jgi:hypothetical protein
MDKSSKVTPENLPAGIFLATGLLRKGLEEAACSNKFNLLKRKKQPGFSGDSFASALLHGAS